MGFFIRELKPGARPIASSERDDVAVCAAYCRLMAFTKASDSMRAENFLYKVYWVLQSIPMTSLMEAWLYFDWHLKTIIDTMFLFLELLRNSWRYLDVYTQLIQLP